MKPEQQEIERLRRELARMKAECDILKRMACPVRKGFVKDGMMVCINVSGLKADALAKMDIRVYRALLQSDAPALLGYLSPMDFERQAQVA